MAYRTTVSLGLVVAFGLMGAARTESWSAFDVARIQVEYNATDGDTEVVIVAKPESDLGLVYFGVRAPGWRQVIDLHSSKRSLGMREFAFESPEPIAGTILDRYPEGPYSIFGLATSGERFFASVSLSHQLPDPTEILFPLNGEIVASDALTIEWAPVANISGFILEFENESVEPEQTLELNLPADVTAFEVPISLLVAGAQYQVGVATVAANGNITFIETEFTTAD